MKKILILGGFPQMIDIVLSAKKMGLYTIVVDMEKESPAKKYADEAILLSTKEIESLKKICIEKGVNAIFTGFEDFNIHIACELCKQLSLPFYGTKFLIDLMTNKKKMKKLCLDNKIPCIPDYTLESAITRKDYPYIVKPTDSYGSRGITICYNEKELHNGINNAKSNSKTNSYIIEKYIDSNCGVELFYTIVNGYVYLTATADRYTIKLSPNGVPLPIAEIFPSKHKDVLHVEIDPLIRQLLTRIGIKNGVVLVQAICSNQKYFIYEFAYRLTGEQHYIPVSIQNGISLSEMMLKLSTGDSIEEFQTHHLSDSGFLKPSINLVIIVKPGVISKVHGLNKIKEISGVISYFVSYEEGDTVKDIENYARIFMRLNVVARDYFELKSIVDQIYNTLKVTSSDGFNMIYEKFIFPEEYFEK